MQPNAKTKPTQGMKKGDKGLCLIAGDIYPIDVISHLPILCEEKDIAYIYVPSKHDLGAYQSPTHAHDGPSTGAEHRTRTLFAGSAAAVKRPTSCVLVSIKGDFSEKDMYNKLVAETRAEAGTA